MEMKSKMNKVISFGLWGNKKKYTIGAIDNCKIAKEIYSGWEVYMFVDKLTVPQEIINQLDATVILKTMEPNTIMGMFWRFLPATFPYVDVMISRDCDSRLDYREKACVDEWLESGKMFHVIRDHPHHNIEILGGTWGIQNSKGKIITQKLINDWPNKKNKGDDQYFLRDCIWPLIKHDVMCHDERFNYLGNRPFPKHQPNKYSTFVGEIINVL